MAWASQFGRTGRSTSSGFTIAHVKSAGDPNVRRLRAYVGQTITIVAQESVGPYYGESTNGSTSERVLIEVPSAIQVYYKLKEETSPGSGVYIDISEPFNSDAIIGRSRPIRSDGESFSFGWLGDSHLDGDPGGTDPALTALRYANAATKLRNYGVDFCIFMDDADTSGQGAEYVGRLFTDDDYTTYCNRMRPFSDYMPIYVVPGNHACFAGFHTNAAVNTALWQRYHINPSPERYWSLRWNNLLECFAIDPFTGTPTQSQMAWTLDQAQATALTSDLAAWTARFRDVFGHHLVGGVPSIPTGYSRGGPGAALEAGTYHAETLHPLLQDGNVDMWGHCHDHWVSHGLVDKPNLLGPGVHYFTNGTPTKFLSGIPTSGYMSGWNENVTMLQTQLEFYGVGIVDVAPTGMTLKFVETDDGNGNARDVTKYEYTITPRWRPHRQAVIAA